jgi:hypothetical protein
MRGKPTFDPESHVYRINGRIVPSVTQVLQDLIPGWQASEWYLLRGRAAHACYALVARGATFEHDPRLAGQVAACHKFFADLKPVVHAIEAPVFSSTYLYAGTPDLICSIDCRRLVLDYKATLTGAVPIQCAAYACAMGAAGPKWGVGVELRDDGTYKMSEVHDLRRHTQEWLALLTAYRVRQRLGCLTKEDRGAV